MQLSFEVAVVGGGIIGASIAAALVERGVHTALIDAGCCGAQGASRFSGGIVRIYDPDADTRVLAAFSHECLSTTSFGRLLNQAVSRVGVIYASASSTAELLNNAIAQYSTEKYPMRLLEGAEVRRISNFVHARPSRVMLYEQCGGVGNVRASVSLMSNLVRSGGVVLENAAIKRVDQEGDRARLTLEQGTISAQVTVIAAGAWTPALAPDACLHTRSIPLVRMFASAPLAIPIIDTVAGTYAVPLAGNLVQVGSQVRQTAPLPEELGSRFGTEYSDAMRRLSDLTGRTEEGSLFDVLPGFDSYTADGKPLIGFLGDDDVRYVAAGLAGIGYKLAPGIAFLASEQIAKRLGRPVESRKNLLAPFDPRRRSSHSTPRSCEVA